jgi:hypothetical protein
MKDKQANKETIFNGQIKESPGLYAYDLKRLVNQLELVTYKLKDSIVGVNHHIDFCNTSQRISFLKDFDSIEMVPVPHRNSINFLGMKPKNNYIIWREMDGVFCALDKNATLEAWVIGTGKTTRCPVTKDTTNIDLKDFELYACSHSD